VTLLHLCRFLFRPAAAEAALVDGRAGVRPQPREKVSVREPHKIIPYYRLSWSTWPLSNNKELLSRFRRVKPGKSHTQDR
jgi:hypothetical protein